MEGRRIFLFATREDLIALFDAADPDGTWKYVDARYLWAEQRPRRVWDSPRGVPRLGRPRTGRKFGSAQLLVMSGRTKVRERSFLVHGRRRRWAVDCQGNPGAALMHPPGVFEPVRALIGGTITTWRSTPAADRVIGALRSALRRGLWPCASKLFWFGPRALELARDGWRCTEDVTSPREHDVVPPRT